MAIEKHWLAQGPVAFTADGTEGGLATLSDTACFKVKMKVVLRSDTLQPAQFQIKRVLSKTQLILGPLDKNIKTKSDLTAYLLADSTTISAEEQPKTHIPEKELMAAVYEQEPTVALRQLGVDKYGEAWSDSNPLPTTASISVDSSNNQGVQNIDTPAVANAEFSITLPDSSKRYQIRVRNHSAKGRIAFAVGETSTKYWSLHRGTIFDSAVLDLPASSVIYMSVSKASQVVEVISYYSA